MVAEAIEGVDGGEEEEGERHVGGDDGAVGEDGRFEGEETEGDEPGDGAEDRCAAKKTNRPRARLKRAIMRRPRSRIASASAL